MAIRSFSRQIFVASGKISSSWIISGNISGSGIKIVGSRSLLIGIIIPPLTAGLSPTLRNIGRHPIILKFYSLNFMKISFITRFYMVAFRWIEISTNDYNWAIIWRHIKEHKHHCILVQLQQMNRVDLVTCSALSTHLLVGNGLQPIPAWIRTKRSHHLYRL